MLALALLTGCAHAPAAQTSSSQRPSTASSRPFVPPFAYEAYIRGELLLAAGKPAEATLQLEMATAAPDEDAYLLSRLAEAQAESGERKLAEQTLVEAERVDACEPAIWMTRGRWAERDADLARAARAYRSAIGCDEGSEEALLALFRVLRAQGDEIEGLALLARAGEVSRGRAGMAALMHALASADVARARFALDSWLSLGALDAASLREAAEQALTRREPTLALTFGELRAAALGPALRAQLLMLTRDRDGLRALLAQHNEAELGGAEPAARIALAVADFERAELYAGLALASADSAAMRALKIEALAAQGQHAEALAETRALSDPGARQRLARDQLTSLGLGALAQELRGAQ